MSGQEQSGDDHGGDVKEFILAESRKGNVVFMGLEGLMVAPLNEFIKQPPKGFFTISTDWQKLS